LTESGSHSVFRIISRLFNPQCSTWSVNPRKREFCSTRNRFLMLRRLGYARARGNFWADCGRLDSMTMGWKRMLVDVVLEG
jgi:hypothetical protein